jgi:hypothetical protein
MNNFKGMDLNGKEPNSTAGSGSSLVFWKCTSFWRFYWLNNPDWKRNSPRAWRRWLQQGIHEGSWIYPIVHVMMPGVRWDELYVSSYYIWDLDSEQ